MTADPQIKKIKKMFLTKRKTKSHNGSFYATQDFGNFSN